MRRAIVFDVSRLFLASTAPTPRGIDRIDWLYARHLFERWPGDCVGVIGTPWGVRTVGRGRVIRGLDRLEELWAERGGGDAALARVKARLHGRAPPGPAPPEGGALRPFGLLAMLGRTGFTFGRAAARNAPHGALYVNIGQLCWAMPYLTAWLGRRPDLAPLFMVHDVIPLDRPDLVWSGAPPLHRMMMQAVARHAAALVVPTTAAREAILGELRRRGRGALPIAAIRHPVSAAFLERAPPDRDLEGLDYFVVCGAIEPRKNHRLLFAVWRKLVAMRGDSAPFLVVAGRRGRAAEPIFAMLAESAELRSRVVLAPDLSSPALARLMAQAKALLMPSLAEGFGLPLVEALTAGAPVIASDLPAHREAAGDFALYLEPRDEGAWLDQICAFSDGTGAAARCRAQLASYRPRTTEDYFAEVSDFFAVLGRPHGCGSGSAAP